MYQSNVPVTPARQISLASVVYVRELVDNVNFYSINSLATLKLSFYFYDRIGNINSNQ